MVYRVPMSLRKGSGNFDGIGDFLSSYLLADTNFHPEPKEHVALTQRKNIQENGVSLAE